MKKLTIMITGASRGIGLATAKRLASQGHNLALFSRNMADTQLDWVEKSEQISYDSIICDSMDASQPADWDNAIEKTLAAFGKIDVLINNAGVLVSGEFEKTDLEQQLQLLDINCKSVLIGCHKMANALTAGGKIINLSSASAIYGQPEIANYSASKFYIRGLTEALNIEFENKGIKVVDVMPLWVASDMTKGKSITSINRLGLRLTTQDVAMALDTLVSTPADKLTKVHYPVGLPAKLFEGLAQVTPSKIVRIINRTVNR